MTSVVSRDPMDEPATRSTIDLIRGMGSPLDLRSFLFDDLDPYAAPDVHEDTAATLPNDLPVFDAEIVEDVPIDETLVDEALIEDAVLEDEAPDPVDEAAPDTQLETTASWTTDPEAASTTKGLVPVWRPPLRKPALTRPALGRPGTRSVTTPPRTPRTPPPARPRTSPVDTPPKRRVSSPPVTPQRPADRPPVTDAVTDAVVAPPEPETLPPTEPQTQPHTEPQTERRAHRRTRRTLLAPPPLVDTEVAPRLRTVLTASRAGTVLSLVLWFVSLPSLRSAKASNYGLLFAGSPLFTLGALVSVLAFCSAVRRGRFGDAIAALLAWIVIVRVTVSVITPLPIYTWTYKHIGVADYIQQHGHVAAGGDIYMAWPGAFTALAWFSSVTGVSLIAIAQWFAVGIHLLIALGIYALCRAAHLSPMAAITAAFLAEVLNWVGQDYLSPQAIAFVLALFVITAMLRARTSALMGWLSVPVFAAVVVTHQLTPYWLLLIAGCLFLGKAVRPRWLFAVYALVAVGYLALHLKVAAEYGLISGFDPLANAESNVSTTGSAGHDFTGLMVRIPAVLLWGSAVIIALRQFRTYRKAKKRGTLEPHPGLPRWIPAVIAFASFSLLAGQSYGGEAIFRVFLYSLPGCVLVVAPALVSGLLAPPRRAGALDRVRRLVVRWSAIAATVLVAATSLQGYYGGWFTNVVRQDSLTEVDLLLRTLPTDSLIFTMTSGVPERPIGRYEEFAQHNKFYDAPLQLSPDIHPKTDTAQDIARVVERLQGNTPGPVYLVITEQMRQYSSYYGVFRPGMLNALPQYLRTDGHWWTIADTPTLQVFRLVGSGE